MNLGKLLERQKEEYENCYLFLILKHSQTFRVRKFGSNPQNVFHSKKIKPFNFCRNPKLQNARIIENMIKLRVNEDDIKRIE